MAISDGRTEASAVKRKLAPIVAQLDDATALFDSIQALVDDEILTQSEADGVADGYKQAVLSEVSNIQTEEGAHADDIARAGVIETNDKIEHITPIIDATPVILPAPTTYTADNVTLLSDQTSLEADVIAQITAIDTVFS